MHEGSPLSPTEKPPSPPEGERSRLYMEQGYLSSIGTLVGSSYAVSVILNKVKNLYT